MHKLFQKQVARATRDDGALDFATLGASVSAAYDDADRDRRRTDRAIDLMAGELETANQELERLVGELSLQNLRFETALDNMSQGLAMYDPDERIVVVNARFAEVLGLPPGSLRPGMTFRDVVALRVEAGHFPGMTVDEVHAERREVLALGTDRDFEELRCGRMLAYATRVMPGGGGVISIEDITARRRAEDRVAHMAQHDALTGLPNRLQFRARLEDALARVRRGEFCAVFCLDLDRFKAVNDTLGHPVGDLLLREVTLRLREMVRETDVVARFGGDEFVMLQSAADQPESASALAQRVVRGLTEPYDIDGHQIVIGASIGIALAPADGQSPDVLLKHADLALYRAKADGRGTWRFFEPDMDARMQARRSLELDLRRAIQANEFELVYQPIIDVESHGIHTVEALLRWDCPQRGRVSPADFIPVAEETGMIVQIGDWVLRRACLQAASWPGDTAVAVNVSVVQFRNPRIVDSVVEALAVSGLPAHRLELEVTETIMLHDSVATVATLHRLRRLGVRISMDDFGTGYSSLSYLRSFPFDKIKIDQSFVKDLERRREAQAIVRAITGLGGSLGMRITAEGVETQEQLSRLRAEGCTEVQGYLFGRPMPSAEVGGFLRDLRHGELPAHRVAEAGIPA